MTFNTIFLSILVAYMAISMDCQKFFNLPVFGILFILSVISIYIETEILRKVKIRFINNKELFNQVEMNYLEKITKNIDNLSDKYYVYREYYDKRNEKFCENMKEIIEQLVEKKEISELSVKLLKPYEKEINLPEYKKEELRKFFAEKVLEKELNSIKMRVE